jgi:CRP/FNR family transcriptional regulator
MSEDSLATLKGERGTHTSVCPSPLFAELEPEEITHLLASVQHFHRERGELIFREGMPPEGVYLICSGKVKLVSQAPDRQKMQILKILGPGELLGEEAFFADMPYNVDARALESTQLCFFGREEFLSFLDRHPSVVLRLLEKLSREIKALERTLVETVYDRAEARLARTLLKLSHSYGIPQASGCTIDLRLTRLELAELIGLRPETTSRILSRWRSHGIVDVQGRRLVILDEQYLTELAKP